MIKNRVDVLQKKNEELIFVKIGVWGHLKEMFDTEGRLIKIRVAVDKNKEKCEV